MVNTVLHTLNIFLQSTQQPRELTLSISGNWGSEKLSKFLKVPNLRSNGESMAHPLNPKLCYLPEYLPHGCLEARLYYSWLLNTMGLNGTDPLVSILGFFCFPNRFVVCYYTIQVGWIHKCESWDMGGWLEVILRIWTVLRWDL